MKKVKISNFDFWGSTQDNLEEYLEVAIHHYYDGLNDGIRRVDVCDLSFHELYYDANNIVNNLIGEADEVEFPDGSTWSREELEQTIFNEIEELVLNEIEELSLYL